MTTTYLSIHYTKTACILDDRVTGERYRTDNTHEDCSGTTIGDWLVDNYADRLESIRDHAEVIYPLGPLTFGEDGLPFTRNANGLPGLIALGNGDSRIDGNAGVHDVLKIAGAIGLVLTETRTHAGDVTGYFVYDTDDFWTLDELAGQVYCTLTHRYGFVCADCTLEELREGGEFFSAEDVNQHAGEVCAECGEALA